MVHIALCKSNYSRIRTWCCNYTVRFKQGFEREKSLPNPWYKQSSKLLRWYRPSKQYPTKYRTQFLKCWKYGVKNIFLSRLTITNRLPELLIKDFNISICKICSRTPNCDFVDDANITLNELCSDGLHLSSKSKYILINNHLGEWKQVFQDDL